jgi:DNA-directed RNA polymerase I subunit RPA49
MGDYVVKNLDSLGFLATNAKQEKYEVFEKNKKRILQGSDSGVRGDEVELHSKYVVAIVRNEELTLLKTIPIQLDTIPVEEVEEKLVQKSAEKRNQLGQAFGTKKRKQQIKQQEMNQIQVETLADVKQMTERIQQTALPRKQEVEEQMMKDKVIPPCNVNAGNPEQVYNVDDICPPHLLALIDVKPLWKARQISDCWNHLKGLYPGQFVKDRLQETLKEKKDKERVKKVSDFDAACVSCLFITILSAKTFSDE